MNVRTLSTNDHQEYRRFLTEDTEGLIYASLEFSAFLTSVIPGKPHCLIALDQERIIGSLPYFEHSNLLGHRIINSLPWFGSYGGCTLAAGAGTEVRQGLISKYLETISHPDVLSATMILNPFEARYFKQYKDILEPDFMQQRTCQISRLPEDKDSSESDLMQSFSKKTRNLVRKSLKQGFQYCESDEDWAWDFLFETHQENMAVVEGRPKPRAHLNAVRKAFFPQHGKLLIAKDGKAPAAALLLLEYNKTVEYFVPVVKVHYRPRQPLSFLIWHGMLQAAARGFIWWNWGGTWESLQSLHHFKAGWGAADMSYPYLIHVNDENLAGLRKNEQENKKQFPFYFTHPYDHTQSRKTRQYAPVV